MAPPQPRSGPAGFAGRASISIAGALGSNALGAASGVVLARVLGPADRGDYALLALAAAFAATVGTLGLHGIYARDVPAGRVRVSVGMLGIQIVASLAIGCVAGASLFASGLAPSVGSRLVLVVAAAAAGAATGTVIEGILQARGRMTSRAGFAVAGPSGALLAMLAVLALGGRSTLVLFAAFALGRLLVTIAGLFLLVDVPPCDAPTVRRGRLADTGGPLMAGAVVTQLLYRADLVVVAALATQQDLGRYAVALGLAEVIWLVASEISTVTLPAASRGMEPRDVARVIRMTTVIVSGLSAVGLALGPVAIPLVYGAEFGDAYSALVPLAVGAVGTSAWKLLVVDLFARGEARHRVTTGLAALVLVVLADLVLVPLAGLAGAGVGAAISYWFACALAVRAWCRATDEPAGLLRPRGSDVRAVASLAGRSARRALGQKS